MIRLFEVHDTTIDEKDPWTGISNSVRFATRAMVHTAMQATPMQLVFGRDAILNVKYEANWKYINERNKKIIKKNNENENKKRKIRHYQVADRVLVKGDRSSEFGDYAYNRPYEIVKVNNNRFHSLNKHSNNLRMGNGCL
eukprot:5676643-Ditylum_brightwellii.AAC.1